MSPPPTTPQSSSTTPPQSQAIDIEAAKFNLTLTLDMVRHAEGKATAILAFSAAIVGVALTEVPEASEVLEFLFEEDYGLLGCALIAFHIAFYAAMGFSIYFALQAVNPKLIAKSSKHSWFFFQSMSLLDPEDYHRFCRSITTDSLLDQLCDQIFNNAVVARKKFEQVRLSLYYALFGGLLAIVAVAPVLVIKGLIGGVES